MAINTQNGREHAPGADSETVMFSTIFVKILSLRMDKPSPTMGILPVGEKVGLFHFNGRDVCDS